MYKFEKGKPFYTSLSILRKLRQIPASTNKYYTLVYNTAFLLSRAISFFGSAVGPLLHLTVSIISDSGSNKTEDISILVAATGAGVICVLFTLKYKEWSDLFKDLTDTTLYGKPSRLDETARRLNSFGNVCFICASLVTVVYGSAAWYTTVNCQDSNEHDRFGQICPTYIPIWLPFGTNNIKVGAVVFVLQAIFVGFLLCQPCLIECYLMFETTEILICHIEQLKVHLKEAFESPSPLEIRNRLRFCINYHIHILKMGYHLNSLIKYTAGHMSLISALGSGCLANQILITKPIGSFIMLAAWLLALLCFCHSGQRIKDSTVSVADIIWSSKWYKADLITKKDVQFMLMRCQKPVNLEALPMGVTDYIFYFTMIKTGYSFFALFHKSL